MSLAAEALHVQGAVRVVGFWQDIIEALSGGPVMLLASRLDVHADFAGLDITDADREAFVCRSGRQSVEFENGALETLYWGKGGDVTVRLYDKLAEVGASGKGGYLLGLYGEAGLRAGEALQRVEAQVRREPLRQLGVVTAEHAIANAGAVYLYAVTKWLRLVVPGSASRRERATNHARWVVVQGANVAAGAQAAARVMPDRHGPALDAMIPTLAGYAVNAGEALGIHDLETVWRQLGLLVSGFLEDRSREFAAEVKARRLDFGTSAA